MKSLRIFGLLAGLVVLGFGFQNCSKPMAVGSATSSSTSKDYIPNTAGTEISNLSLATSVDVIASEEVQKDCSDAKAKIEFQVKNVDNNVRFCSSYSLDLPVSSARVDRVFECNEDSKFKAPDAEWTYNSQTRTWKMLNGAVSLKSHPYIVPGSYKLYVKDASGKVTVSRPLVVKHANSENCNPVAAALPKTLKWVMTNYTVCVGPGPAPAAIGAACSVAGQTVTNACGTATCQLAE